ncbi:MAG: DNA repair protein RecO, partial [Myxococcales bacterium]|nr:DNA repair protein RecO [Myxococcales bacterium]
SGEADRVVTLLTRELGKVQALARGARRSRHRFGAALAPFGHGEATLRQGRLEGMFWLEGLYGARGFPRLPLEMGRLSHASYAVELCRELCPLLEPEPQVLDLLLALLGALDRLPPSERPSVLPLRCFELGLLEALGLGVALSACAACGGPVGPGAVPFDRLRGGVLCAGCHEGGQGGQTVDEEARTLLVRLSGLRPDSPELATLPQSPAVLDACRDLLLGVVRHHLGRTPKAVEFIARMRMKMDRLSL